MIETEFDNVDIGTNPVAAIRAEAEQLMAQPEIKSNTDVLNTLLDDVKPVSFQEKVYPEAAALWKRLNEETDDDEKGKIAAKIKQFRVTDRQKYVVIIEELLQLATARKWGICLLFISLMALFGMNLTRKYYKSFWATVPNV